MAKSNNKSHKTFFMPLLCRFSLNDTIVPPKPNNYTSAADPSSPKLSCIGQLKKRPPTTTTATTTTTAMHSNRYRNLHKLFSGRNLMSPAIDRYETVSINKFNININNNTKVTKRSKSCNSRGRTAINKKKCYIISNDDHDKDIELDPPLPVVKCCNGDRESNVNLWKRRGVEIKSLQIQPARLDFNRKMSGATTL